MHAIRPARFLAWALLVCADAIVATAQTPPAITFLAPVPHDTGEAGPAETERADWNGDGLTDLAVRTTGNGGEIHFLYGDGKGGLFKDPTLGVALAAGFGGGDFNGDGLRDVAVVQSGTSPGGSYGLCGSVPGTIVFLASAGPTPFVFHQCVPGHVSITLNDVVAGDFTGDGRLDLAVADDGLWGMRVYPGNADGTFAVAPVQATGAGGLRVHGPLFALDLNGDGRLDVMGRTGAPLGGAGGIATFLGTGGGVLAFYSTPAGGSIAQHMGVLAVAAGDVNGDGVTDLVGVEQGRAAAGAPLHNWAFAALGTGDGRSYSTAWTLQFPDGAVGDVGLADLNKDGAADVVAIHAGGNATRVHPGYGNGTFVSSAVVVPVGAGPKYLELADWNRDTWIDLAVVDLNANGPSTTWVVPQAPRAGDTTPPVVSLTAPLAGATLQGSVTLTAVASDAGGIARVEFLRGGVVIAVDTASPHTVTWDTTLVPNGLYALTARAFDNAGNSTMSDPPATVTVANLVPPPTVDLVVSALTGTAPAAAGASVAVTDTTRNQGAAGVGASVTRLYFSWDGALDPADVEIGARAVPALAPGASSTGTTPVVIPGGVPGSTYHFLAVADAAGAIAETSEANNIRVRVVARPAASERLSFDADARTDVSVYRPSTAEWHVLPSSTDFSAGWVPTTFGNPAGGDLPLLGDFDGDGRRDVAVYRPSTGTWFWLESSVDGAQYAWKGWGQEVHGDVPAPGDYDGDGRTDPTVYRPATGTWFILKSGGTYTQYLAVGWGAPADVPMPGDYDGDGRTDVAVYRPSTGQWFVRPSVTDFATAWAPRTFGQAGDVPVRGDFDGDGKRDFAVYRPSTGTWFWLESSTEAATATFVGWGMDAHGDVPVPGDYDGDGKTDPAVYRPASGTWFLLRSGADHTQYWALGWGVASDVPLGGAR